MRIEWIDKVDDVRGSGSAAAPADAIRPTDCLTLRVKRAVMLHTGDY